MEHEMTRCPNEEPKGTIVEGPNDPVAFHLFQKRQQGQFLRARGNGDTAVGDSAVRIGSWDNLRL